MKDWIEEFSRHIAVQQSIEQFVTLAYSDPPPRSIFNDVFLRLRFWVRLLESADDFRAANPDCGLTSKRLATELLDKQEIPRREQ